DLSHYLPYAVARLRYGFTDYDECRVRISRSPETYFDRFYADTAMAFDAPSLRCAIEALGKKRILLGTDFPFGYTTRGVETTLETLAGLGLSPEDLAGILSGNLRALLRLPK
ncbi:MAG: amidohydrolase family protein, partial [candidate division NC10 bacterium]